MYFHSFKLLSAYTFFNPIIECAKVSNFMEYKKLYHAFTCSNLFNSIYQI